VVGGDALITCFPSHGVTVGVIHCSFTIFSSKWCSSSFFRVAWHVVDYVVD